MIIRRKSNERKFTITPQEWETIVGNGMSYKYEVIDDNKPIELKRLKDEIAKKQNAKQEAQKEAEPIELKKKQTKKNNAGN